KQRQHGGSRHIRKDQLLRFLLPSFEPSRQSMSVSSVKRCLWGTNNPNMEETGSLENPIRSGKCDLDLNRARKSKRSRSNSTTPRVELWQINTKPRTSCRSQALVTGRQKRTSSGRLEGAKAALRAFSAV